MRAAESPRKRPITAYGERSVAAGGDIGCVVTGTLVRIDKMVVTGQEVPGLPLSPRKLSNLPGPKCLLIGRERELACLDAAFGAESGPLVYVVHGLGGVGKSALAERWASTQAVAHNPVWRVKASSAADLNAGLVALAVNLEPRFRSVAPEDTLGAMTRWLADHDGWLLILDDVAAQRDIEALLDSTPNGRFLITTRRATGWEKMADSLPLDVLELPQAVALFEQRHPPTPKEPEGRAESVKELCRVLGCLPLAIEQASAYCAEAGVTPQKYLDLLESSPETMFAGTAENGDPERTVARVWHVTLERLAHAPLAEDILRVIAWWSAEGIPCVYLDPLADPPDLVDALRLLTAYSMITQQDGTIAVHPLVQAVARTLHGTRADRAELCPQALAEARDVATRLLLDNWEQHRDRTAGTEWITHAQALAERIRPGTETESGVMLFSCIGSWRAGHLLEAGAVEAYERALAAAERVCGPRHPLTVDVRARLARVCGLAGQHDRAIALLEQNVADTRRRRLRRKDPLTFRARSELAMGLLRAGDIERGLALARQTIEQAERALGRDHPVALEATVVQARAWRMAAEIDPHRFASDAVATTMPRLAMVIETQGEDNDTVDELTWELIWMYSAAGCLTEAIVLTEGAVEYSTRHRGRLDGATLSARQVLIAHLRATGDVGRARELAGPLLSDAERALGDVSYTRQLREALGPLLADPDPHP